MDVDTLPCECHSVNKISLLITTAHQQCLRSLAVSDECIPEWLSIICSLQNWGLVCWEATSGVKSRVLCHSSSVLLHLGRQRQHSVVICSGTLLFSSKVLHPSMVTLCSHKSGRCAVELYHDKTEWRLISATLCRWKRCFVADQLWLMSRIQEEKVLLCMCDALESKSHPQLDRCPAATVWIARRHSNMHHSLSSLAAWKPHQCTSTRRHQLNPTCRNMFIRNQWGMSMSWSSMWVIHGQQPAELYWSSDWSVTRLF